MMQERETAHKICIKQDCFHLARHLKQSEKVQDGSAPSKAACYTSFAVIVLSIMIIMCQLCKCMNMVYFQDIVCDVTHIIV